MNKKNLSVLMITLMLGAFLLTACATPAVEPTQDNASIIATSIQQTMQSLQETQSAGSTPTLANTPTSPSTGAEVPTLAIVSPPTAIPTAMSTNCLVAGLVSETYPDNTLVAKGVKFTKTWKVINGGTCAWTTAYKFVFVSGYDLGATKEIALPENVPPGGITDISLEMTAPNSDGTYIGDWALKTDAGVLVGNYSVKIIVGTPTAAPYMVTSVNTSATNQTPAACPFSYSFNVVIATNNPGTVSYYFEDSLVAGQYGNNSAYFATAGTVTTTPTLIIPNVSGVHTMTIYIDQPNHQNFGQAFTVKCP